MTRIDRSAWPWPGQALIGRRQAVALAVGGVLAGCANPPNLKDYLAEDGAGLRREFLRRRTPPSAPERAAVLATLSSEQSRDALNRQLALQQALSEAPLVGGNRTTLLRDGAQALPAMFAALHGARNNINLECYIVSDVAWGGRSLSDVLLERLRRGIVVNIIYDAYGSQATPRAFFDRLHAAGARIVEFNPLDPLRAKGGWNPNDRDHRKIMVIDGRIGFTGGVNLDTVYENPPSAGVPPDGDARHAYWRDTAVRVEGPAVAELQRLFFGTWAVQKGPPVLPAQYYPPLGRAGDETVRIIGSAPGDSRPLYYIALMTAVLSATQRVWLSSGYFVPPHEEREDLAKITRSGVDLRIVVPSHADVPATIYAARAAYGELLESGARIYEVQNAVLHSKLATVDGVWSTIGSSNLDRRSVVFNNEVDAIILGRNTAAQVEAVLRQDMAMAHEITLAEWRRRSLGERWDEIWARVWQYWM